MVGAIGWFRVEHLHGIDEQQHAAADLEGCNRDPEEAQQLQPRQGARRNDQENRERTHPDGALTLGWGEVRREVDEERDYADRVEHGE